MQASIRDSAHSDDDTILALYPGAFPDEDLVPLVQKLLNDTSNVVSLVATIDSRIAGHVAFTHGRIPGHEVSAALLGPLAVSPPLQNQGIGSALVRDGLQRLKALGVDLVFVLGDPRYYSRFGFMPQSAIQPPYPMPAEWQDAWQLLQIGRLAASSGKLVLPDMWMDAALWGP